MAGLKRNNFNILGAPNEHPNKIIIYGNWFIFFGLVAVFYFIGNYKINQSIVIPFEVIKQTTKQSCRLVLLVNRQNQVIDKEQSIMLIPKNLSSKNELIFWGSIDSVGKDEQNISIVCVKLRESSSHGCNMGPGTEGKMELRTSKSFMSILTY